MLEKQQRETLPITLSPTHKEAPLALEEKILPALEIAVTEIAKEPATILNHAEEAVLDDIAALKIRSARKVASALGIRQKANGADKSLNRLQQEIRQSLQSKPEQVIQALELAKVC